MTDDELAFIKAICDSPDDDTPRLVYADHIQDEGTPEAIARAEFIRVQCELGGLAHQRTERLDDDSADWSKCTSVSAVWCPNCGDCVCRDREHSRSDKGCPLHDPESLHDCLEYLACRERILRQREMELWELWDRFGHGWCKSVAEEIGYAGSMLRDGTARVDLADIGVGITFRRGFPAVVRCPLATWVGGVCSQCDHGAVYAGQSSYPCRHCSGTGRTPSIAGKVIAACPTIDRVEIPDAAIFQSGGNDTYYVGGLGIFPQKYWRRLELHRTRHSVISALYTASLDYGREQSGLGWWPYAAGIAAGS